MARTSKIFILILAARLLMLISPASAWELRTGRVTGIETLDKTVRLTINRTGVFSADDRSETLMTIEIPGKELPENLKKGDLVRIWSNTNARETVFKITPLRGSDPTGVRSRLRRRGHRFAGGHGGKGGHGGH